MNTNQSNTNNYSLKQNRFVFEELILASKYSDQLSRQNNYSICMLTICELLEVRFKLKNLVNNKIIQDHLTLAVLCEFELTEKWFNSFLAKISLTLKNIFKIELIVSIDDFLGPAILSVLN